MKFLSELKSLSESHHDVKNVVFKLEIPEDADALLALPKGEQMSAIEGTEEGDDSFIQNQDIVTVEYISREGSRILVYPMLSALKSSSVSELAHKLQKAFTDWCLSYEGAPLDEAVQHDPNASEMEAMEAGIVFGEVGEELLKLQSQLDSELAAQLVNLEAKHGVYLGEDLRELKQFIKLAIKSATKLHEALTDIPVSDTGSENHHFTWRG